MNPLLERAKRYAPLGFAAVMAVFATLLFRQHFKQKEEALQQKERMLNEKLLATQHNLVDLVAAASDLPLGAKLELSSLKKITVPEQFAQPYAARSPNDVVGKVTV